MESTQVPITTALNIAQRININMPMMMIASGCVLLNAQMAFLLTN